MIVDEPDIYFGKSALQWLQLYHHCHNPGLTGLMQWCFPDGMSLNDQPNYVPEIFDVITAQIGILQRQSKAKK